MTKGTCSRCRKTMSKGAMTRHLGTCGRAERGDPAWLISVCARHAPADYWAHLEVPGDATLHALDGYLRELWLECCGHLSQFEIRGRTYALGADLFDGGADPFGDFDDASMDVDIGDVLSPGQEARHIYDMGSTTELVVRCLEERADGGDGDHPAAGPKRATAHRLRGVRSAGDDHLRRMPLGRSRHLCGACASEHACDDEMYLPLTNSPRSGVCGYVGGAAMA